VSTAEEWFDYLVEATENTAVDQSAESESRE
jgi:hypothetical protein